MKKMMMGVLMCGVVSGCGLDGTEPGNDMAEPVDCNYSETAVAWSDEAPNGVVPGEVFDGLSTTATVEADESPSAGEELSVMIERDGDDAFYLESDVCESRLELPLIFSVATVDGDALDEAFAVRAMVREEGRVDVDHRFEVSELNGTYAPSVDEADTTVLGMVLSADVGPTESEAMILVDLEQSSGDAVSNFLQRDWVWSW
ncbi:hypothetical protein EA187_15710 [Lujinxingia sediminis]|uniref:Lipoprotein n=1 Tax=Lujinxingia sediminis TaxID=2480984 RepID=A0ABY0CQ64_9DELT|nr:hypothetical protein [Lujinxingia sediminis]RVU42632.1 hypothetical protein EA187_15710 [Lujinxingia sediminis]